MNHEIQFDGQEGLEGNLDSFAAVIANVGADLAPDDYVVARIILAPDEDLEVGVKARLPKEDALYCLKFALEERANALAAVRPPVAVVEAAVEPEPVEPAEPVEIASEGEPSAESGEPKTKKAAKK